MKRHEANVVEIRPLVSAYITDHLLRANLPSTAGEPCLKPVYGVLVGRVESSANGATIHVLDIFPVVSAKQSNFEARRLEKIMVEYYRDLKVVGWYHTTTTDGQEMSCIDAIHLKLRELTPVEPILLLKPHGHQVSIEQVTAHHLQSESRDAGDGKSSQANQSSLPTLSEIECRMSLDQETTMDRVLRMNLLSFDSPNPKQRWLEAPAHQQLLNGELRREWLGPNPRFWDYNLSQPAREETENPTISTQEVLRSSRLMVKKRKYGAAKSHLDQALVRRPLDPELLEMRGVAAEEQGDLLEADNFYRRSLAQNPDQAEAKQRLDGIVGEVEQIQSERLLKVWKRAEELDRVPRCNPALKASLIDLFRRCVHGTLAIEGNAMTVEETTRVFENERVRIEGRSDKDHAEVLGLKEAIEYVIGDNMCVGAITLQNLLDIHRRVVGRVEEMKGDTGVFRTCRVSVGNLLAPDPGELPALMANFITFLNCPDTLQHIDVVELAVHAHLWMVVLIHPFTDGNGRSTRLLMDFFLLKAGFPSLIVPADRPERNAYYKCLNEATFGAERSFVMLLPSLLDNVLDKHIEKLDIFDATHNLN